MNIQEYQTQSGQKKYKVSAVYIGTDIMTGKKIKTTVSASSKKAVKDKIARIKADFEKNGCVQKKVKADTFEDVAELWLKQYKLEVKTRSYNLARTRLNTYLIPAFGSYKIEKMNRVMVQEKIKEWALLAAKPVKGSTQIGATRRQKGEAKDYADRLNIMNRIYKYAISLGLTENNPTINVLVPKIKLEKTEREIKFFNPKELQQLFNFIDNFESSSYTRNTLKPLYHLMVSTELRIGEAMALGWSDIDFKQATLTVSKTTLLNKGTSIQDTPKTSHSNRTINLTDKTIKDLKAWRAY